MRSYRKNQVNIERMENEGYLGQSKNAFLKLKNGFKCDMLKMHTTDFIRF